MQEEWKEVSIRGLGARYEVSNFGRVRWKPRPVKVHRERFYGGQKKRKPRIYVSLSDETGKAHRLLVSRLVAREFCPNSRPDVAVEVNHKDGDPTNNKSSNLEWVTGEENRGHALRFGLIPCGESHPNYAIDRRRVREMFLAGKKNPHIAKELGCTKEAISGILLILGLRKKCIGRLEKRAVIVSALIKAKAPVNKKWKKIRSMYISGLSSDAIAMKLAVSGSGVRQAIRTMTMPHPSPALRGG